MDFLTGDKQQQTLWSTHLIHKQWTISKLYDKLSKKSHKIEATILNADLLMQRPQTSTKMSGNNCW